jgi:hypothetical protein
MHSKSWKKMAEGQYAFYVDDVESGQMQISYNSLERKAQCEVNGVPFQIKRTGFWKTSIDISKATGEVIGKVYPEKWYASSWSFEFGNKKYRIIIRNNPMAEYAILDGTTEIAAYGLDANNGHPKVRITSTDKEADFIFDFLLWYLFVPTATENSEDHLVFLLLVTA